MGCCSASGTRLRYRAMGIGKLSTISASETVTCELDLRNNPLYDVTYFSPSTGNVLKVLQFDEAAFANPPSLSQLTELRVLKIKHTKSLASWPVFNSLANMELMDYILCSQRN